MDENLQAEEGISLLEIIRVLFHKLHILILVLVIGAVSGVLFGVWRTADVKYYGTTIEFYINPEKPKDTGTSTSLAANSIGSQYGVYGAYGRHVMDAIVKLLASESFAEQMMLEENGLPDPKIYPNLDEKKYQAAETALANNDNAWKKVEKKNEAYAIALAEMKNTWNTLPEATVSFSDSAYEKLLFINPDLEEKYPSLAAAHEAYKTTKEERDKVLAEAEKTQDNTDKIVDSLLNNWRAKPEYAKNLKVFQESVTYSYLGDDEDVEDANNLARSFIYVKINVLKDEALANEILDRVKVAVPSYVEKNMIVPTDYEGTSCTRITRSDKIVRTNPNYTRNQSLKYGLLLAFAACAVTAVIIILVDQTDKRLRSHEVITKKFNVPILGIVPTIEEINQKSESKKNEEKHKNAEGAKWNFFKK